MVKKNTNKIWKKPTTRPFFQMVLKLGICKASPEKDQVTIFFSLWFIKNV